MTGLDTVIIQAVLKVGIQYFAPAAARAFAKGTGRSRDFAGSLDAIRGDVARTYIPIRELPQGISLRDAQLALESPMSATLIRQLMAAQILGEFALLPQIKDSLTTFFQLEFPETPPSKLRPFAQSIYASLQARSEVAARTFQRNLLTGRITDKGGAESISVPIFNWAIDTVDSYLHELRETTSLHEERRWTKAYKTVFKDSEQQILLPDLDARTTMRLPDIYLAPAVVYADELNQRQGSAQDIETDNVVILGVPGAGKSTLVRWMALNTLPSERVPFIIPCKSIRVHKQGFDLVGTIVNDLRLRYSIEAGDSLIRKLLLEGRSVLYFDGLDEILDPGSRRSVVTSIESVRRRFPFAQTVVTCRIIGYREAAARKELFNEAIIQDFTDEQVEQYVIKWFSSTPGLRAAERSEFAASFMRDSRSVSDLRSNPLLLAFLCILYKGHRAIPRRRAEVLQRCVDLLLGQWDKARLITDELQDLERARLALSRLAFLTLTDPAFVFGIETTRAIDEIAAYLTSEEGIPTRAAQQHAKDILALCRGRSWMFTDVVRPDSGGQGSEAFDFTHASFREYFTAIYLNRTVESPEDLARRLGSELAGGSWEILGSVVLMLRFASSSTHSGRMVQELLRQIESGTRESLARPSSGVLQFLAEATDYAKLGPKELIGISANALEALASGNTSSIAVLVDERHSNREALDDALSHVIRDWATQDIFTADVLEERRLAVALLINHLLQPLQLPGNHWYSADGGPKYISAAMRVPEDSLLAKVLRTPSAVRSIALMSRPDLLDAVAPQESVGIAFEPLTLGIRSPDTITTWIYDCLTKEPRTWVHSPSAVAWLRRLGDAASTPDLLFANPILVTGSMSDKILVDMLLRKSAGYGARALAGAILLSAFIIERRSPHRWPDDELDPSAAWLSDIADVYAPDTSRLVGWWAHDGCRFWKAEEGYMEG